MARDPSRFYVDHYTWLIDHRRGERRAGGVRCNIYTTWTYKDNLYAIYIYIYIILYNIARNRERFRNRNLPRILFSNRSDDVDQYNIIYFINYHNILCIKLSLLSDTHVYIHTYNTHTYHAHAPSLIVRNRAATKCFRFIAHAPTVKNTINNNNVFFDPNVNPLGGRTMYMLKWRGKRMTKNLTHFEPSACMQSS